MLRTFRIDQAAAETGFGREYGADTDPELQRFDIANASGIW
jgi:hypothetical protein